MPTRLPVLAARARTATAVVVAVSLGLTYAITATLLAEYDLVPRLGNPQTWQVAGETADVLVASALSALGM